MAGYRGGFGGGFGGGNQMQNLMKQAQKMQEDMQKAQEDLENSELTGTSGGGLVSVTVTGKKIVKRINIKPEAVDTEDLEMLEDLIIAALNDAYTQAEELSQKKLGAYANLGGMI